MEVKDVCIIRATEPNDFAARAYREYGFHHVDPYNDRNAFMHGIRDLWFKLRLPKKELWFNPEIRQIKEKTIIVMDRMVCGDLMRYLVEKYPDATIILDYENRVSSSSAESTARMYADECWSSSAEDCRKYRMRLKPISYYDVYRVKDNDDSSCQLIDTNSELGKDVPEFMKTGIPAGDQIKIKPPKHTDVLYIGHDRGQADQLMELEKQLNSMGLRTDFRIVAGKKYQRFSKRYYQNEVPYAEYIDIVNRSRAMLDYLPEDSLNPTQREMEAIFNSMKCITNVKAVKQYEFYHPDRFFILGEDDLKELPAFIRRPFPKLTEAELERYKFVNVIEHMLQK